MTPSIVEPTAPVAPTTATLIALATFGRCTPATSSGCTASAPSSNAVCSSRTASSTSSSRTTQEILIGEVEIISMFTPASPSAVNALAATPGWLFIPAPTSETFPICSSDWICAEAELRLERLERLARRRQVVARDRERHVRPVALRLAARSG